MRHESLTIMALLCTLCTCCLLRQEHGDWAAGMHCIPHKAVKSEFPHILEPFSCDTSWLHMAPSIEAARRQAQFQFQSCSCKIGKRPGPLFSATFALVLV